MFEPVLPKSNRMKVYVVLLFTVSLLGTGCSSQLEDFVAGGGKRAPGSAVANPSLFGEGQGYRMSPGANIVVGSQVKSQFVLSPAQRLVKGTQVKSVFTLHARQIQ